MRSSNRRRTKRASARDRKGDATTMSTSGSTAQFEDMSSYKTRYVYDLNGNYRSRAVLSYFHRRLWTGLQSRLLSPKSRCPYFLFSSSTNSRNMDAGFSYYSGYHKSGLCLLSVAYLSISTSRPVLRMCLAEAPEIIGDHWRHQNSQTLYTTDAGFPTRDYICPHHQKSRIKTAMPYG